LRPQGKQWIEDFLALEEMGSWKGSRRNSSLPTSTAWFTTPPNKFDSMGADIICATAGVEKNDDNAKHNFYSSNRHDPCGEVLRTEKRLEKLDDACRREKRAYAKQNQQYWSGGISTQRAAKRARSTGDS
jgi:hypothetical protein